ncbi:hypothetical protein BGZ46_000345 [Entomortierella lignicola]|nr:hypothetical protein BGZ46_000345 [Entomortierella lignicola]
MKPAEVNVDIVFQRLVGVTGITPKPGYEIVSDSDGQRQDNNREEVEKEMPNPERLTIEACQARRMQGGNYIIIYLATDGVYPRRNILFRKIFGHLAEFKEMKNSDGVRLSKDLIPILDALVTAKGR